MGVALGIRRVERRRAFLLVAGLVASCACLDLASGQPLRVLLPHAALFLAMVSGAAIATRSPDRWLRRGTLLAVLVGLSGVTWLAQLGGGVYGGWFSSLVVVPFAIALFAPADPVFVGIGGLATLASGALLAIAARRPLQADLFWAAPMLSSTALAVYGSAMDRRRVLSESGAEQRGLEQRERMQATERLAAVGTLAAGVGHEINNPLAYVKANLDWLCDENLSSQATPAERRAALAECLHGVERIQATVADLRLLSRREDESRDQVTVGETVDEALRIARLRTRTAAEVRREVPDGLPPVNASRRRVVQVLVNLLVNAADAVEARPPGSRVIRIWAGVEEGWVLIGVDDSGPGLAPEVRARLFEPLFTTKDAVGGTGLGLLLSREYVEKSGGSLTAGDAPGGGARFVVRLPQPPR